MAVLPQSPSWPILAGVRRGQCCCHQSREQTGTDFVPARDKENAVGLFLDK